METCEVLFNYVGKGGKRVVERMEGRSKREDDGILPRSACIEMERRGGRGRRR